MLGYLGIIERGGEGGGGGGRGRHNRRTEEGGRPYNKRVVENSVLGKRDQTSFRATGHILRNAERKEAKVCKEKASMLPCCMGMKANLTRGPKSFWGQGSYPRYFVVRYYCGMKKGGDAGCCVLLGI